MGMDIYGEAAGDRSGTSVSMSSDGSILAIGADYNNGNGEWSGHVRVYTWKDDTSPPFWQQKGMDIDGEAIGDASGWSVSLSSDGSVLAIGAPFNDGNGIGAGHVRVYEWDGNNWQQRGADIDGEATSDFSGFSVSLSSDGTILAIGATDNGIYSGHVRMYEWNIASTSWQQMGADIDGEAAGDGSGYSVSMSSDGTVLAIGAYRNDGINGTDSGHVRVYEWNTSSWQQKGFDIDGEAANDDSGRSVSLSGNGNVVAIGAPSNYSGNGSVRVYEWNGSSWQRKGTDIDGEARWDYFGYSVSLSSDGTIVAIGAPGNNGDNGDRSAGHVRVYEYMMN